MNKAAHGGDWDHFEIKLLTSYLHGYEMLIISTDRVQRLSIQKGRGTL